MGLNISQFQQCLDTEKYKAQVDADVADAIEIGASSAPTWYIGKTSSDGIIAGTQIIIHGKEPISEFKEIIESELKK